MRTVSRDFADWAPPSIGPDDPAALVLTSALAQAGHWIALHTPRALAAEPEGVHLLRATVRRLRSTLRLFRGQTEPRWSESLETELKWLGAVLGAVRDLDVFADRLVDASETLDQASFKALGPLFDDLRDRRRRGMESLRGALRGARHATLRERIAAGAPPLSDEADAPCREALPPLVLAAWNALRRGGRALALSDPDEAFHTVRKQAKRARYAAETVAPALDPGPCRAAQRFAKKARRVQDVLGAHQDATIAEAMIQEAAAARPALGPFNLAAGRLIERESRAATEARAQFFQVWQALDRKKSVKWLRV
ncbi:MAG: CHAD domain-containing protein [Isosphaeraceae bacterium]